MDQPITILETQRLLLRHILPEDVPALTDLWTDPQVTRYMGGPREREELQAGLEAGSLNPFEYEYDLWPVVEKESGAVIGHCGLLDKEVEGQMEYEFIYVFTPSAWGKGYAVEVGEGLKTYAREQKGLARLIALIDPENAPSEKVAVKLGFQLEKVVERPGGEIRRVYAVGLTV